MVRTKSRHQHVALSCVTLIQLHTPGPHCYVTFRVDAPHPVSTSEYLPECQFWSKIIGEGEAFTLLASNSYCTSPNIVVPENLSSALCTVSIHDYFSSLLRKRFTSVFVSLAILESG